MKFSVLMSVYYKEQADFLRQALDSVFNQTLRADEVVLVEDGPLTEELDEVVEEYQQRYSELKVVKLKENGGLGKALNEGLKHCSNELVARMDTDDISKPDRFEKQIKFLEEHKEIDVVSSWIDEFVGTTDNVISTRKLPETTEEIFRFGKGRNPINHPSVVFRKSAVLKAGSYQHFPLFEDYYLWVRMLMQGAKFYNLQEALLFFRTTEDMFKRRGGLKYAKTEMKFQRAMLKLGYINSLQFCKNICIRFISRIVPNGLRGWIYRRIRG
ncbi:MAG: glycosyltransferase [Bacteroidota bacterium]|nr:glycosyltransferase [Bacteroidota bacterium]